MGEYSKWDVWSMLGLGVTVGLRIAIPHVQRLAAIAVLTDIFYSRRSCEPILVFSSRRDLFDEVDRQARDLTVMDKSSEPLVITASYRANECFELG